MANPKFYLKRSLPFRSYWRDVAPALDDACPNSVSNSLTGLMCCFAYFPALAAIVRGSSTVTVAVRKYS